MARTNEVGTPAKSSDLCFACQYAEKYPNTTTKRCVMRRAGYDQCSGQLADMASSEKVLDIVEEMLSLNEEHDRLLDVLDIEADPDNQCFGGRRAAMFLTTKTGRRYKITVEESVCRRCRLPQVISDDHDRGCSWHPSRRTSSGEVL